MQKVKYRGNTDYNIRYRNKSDKAKAKRNLRLNRFLERADELIYSYGNICSLDYTMQTETKMLEKTGMITGRKL